MPTNLQVVVEPHTFQLKSGLITGVIYLKWDVNAFPDANWNDFVLPIINSMIVAVLDVTSGRSAKIEFMDGPFRIALSPLGKQASVQFLQDTRKETHLTKELFVELASLATVIHNAASRTLEKCYLENWSTRDVRQLQNNLRHFEIGRKVER